MPGRFLFTSLGLAVLLLSACRSETPVTNNNQSPTPSAPAGPQLSVFSSAFSNGGMIPQDYTCEGSNYSPPISWIGAPAQTKTLALIVDDPDAPGKTWVHWVLFNLPGSVTELSARIPPLETLPNGARQGTNDFRKLGYGGACPPAGTHRYFFKVYALDTELSLGSNATAGDLMKAMDGHVLAEGQMVGKYVRIQNAK